MTLKMYDYYNTFFTGTSFQPDVLHIFMKSNKNQHIRSIQAVPLANFCGIMPILSCFSGLVRIIDSVKVIFKELAKFHERQHDAAEMKNAMKNLMRGIIEVIPLTGTVLVIFDIVRFIIGLKAIDKSVQDKEDIVGVALDKKVIFTMDSHFIDEFLKAPEKHLDEKRLRVFEYLCLETLKEAAKKGEKRKMEDVLLRLKDLIEKKELLGKPIAEAA